MHTTWGVILMEHGTEALKVVQNWSVAHSLWTQTMLKKLTWVVVRLGSMSDVATRWNILNLIRESLGSIMNALESKYYDKMRPCPIKISFWRGWKVGDNDVAACLVSDLNNQNICNQTREIKCIFQVRILPLDYTNINSIHLSNRAVNSRLPQIIKMLILWKMKVTINFDQIQTLIKKNFMQTVIRR